MVVFLHGPGGATLQQSELEPVESGVDQGSAGDQEVAQIESPSQSLGEGQAVPLSHSGGIAEQAVGREQADPGGKPPRFDFPGKGGPEPVEGWGSGNLNGGKPAGGPVVPDGLGDLDQQLLFGPIVIVDQPLGTVSPVGDFFDCPVVQSMQNDYVDRGSKDSFLHRGILQDRVTD